MDSVEIAVQDFAQFKANQRELWAGFGANEGFTTIPAGELGGLCEGLTWREGSGCDLRNRRRCGHRGPCRSQSKWARPHARSLGEGAGKMRGLRRWRWDFTEGDAESLPYADATFDVVLSQFGHMFAPRPEVATSEMLRVLRPGGRIAFYDLASGTHDGTPLRHDVALLAVTRGQSAKARAPSSLG